MNSNVEASKRKVIGADEATKLIEPGWNRLLSLLEVIPEDLAAEQGVVGDWSIDLVIGHIAFWERHAAQVIRMEKTGEAIAPIDVDALNAQAAEEDRKRAHRDLLESLQADHELLLATLNEAQTVVRDRLGGDTWDHYPEHIEQIEAWRASKGI
ncbi:MAG: DinB family protein [Thermomicrobiales bacterium]